MPSQLPILNFGESHFFDNISNNLYFRHIPVPNVTVYCEKHNGVKRFFFKHEENPEFTHFLWRCYEDMIPVPSTRDWLRGNLLINMELYGCVYDKDPERLKEIRTNRIIRKTDELEMHRFYDNIPKTPEEIRYAESITKSDFMIISRRNKDYREKTESDINLSGNLAQVIIASKDDE